MNALLWIPLVAPTLLALACLALRTSRITGLAPMAASVIALGSGTALIVVTSSHSSVSGVFGLLRADALSAYLLAVIGAVGLTATWGSLDLRPSDPRRESTLNTLLCAFLTAMSLAVLADSLGVVWIAIEATTITTAFLVGHYRTRQSLEAAWKYVVLGSTGVAIALLGIVILYAATATAGHPTLSWTGLMQMAHELNPTTVKIAAALAVIGFATKAGLAPMHSWLPDAHGQAPAAVSGLMSGVLLAVAFYAILRVQAVADAALGIGLMRAMLATAGLLSLGIAAALLIRQKDYKRMLAYSSIEHMGLLALGAAAGGTLAIAAVLLHILGHGLTKSSLFVVAGRIVAAEGSTEIASVHGLLARHPQLARPFLIGLAALLGFPPFSLFFSELGILLGGWQRGIGWIMAIALVLILIAFAALARLGMKMSFGTPNTADVSGDGAIKRTSTIGFRLPIVLALAVTAVAGFVAVPLGEAIVRAAQSLAGQ